MKYLLYLPIVQELLESILNSLSTSKFRYVINNCFNRISNLQKQKYAEYTHSSSFVGYYLGFNTYRKFFLPKLSIIYLILA